MNVSIAEIGGSVVAEVEGEVDADNCATFAESLRGLPTDLPVVLDLARLSFIDSSGVSALLDLRNEVTGRGQTFVVRNPTPAVRRVLEITGLVDLFGVL